MHDQCGEQILFLAGKNELERAGAYCVYQDPADLLRHIEEIGVRAAV